MTLTEWRSVCGYVFRAYGIRHFTPDEVARVGRRNRGAVLQAPAPELLQNIILFAKWLEGFRADIQLSNEDEIGLHVNSWYRDPVYNAAIAAAEMSMHLTGAAADIWTIRHSPLELARKLNKRPDADKLGIGLYGKKVNGRYALTFVHVDVRGLIGRRRAPARWSHGVEAALTDWWEHNE